MRCRWYFLRVKEILRRMVPEAEGICRAADGDNRKDRNPEPGTELSTVISSDECRVSAAPMCVLGNPAASGRIKVNNFNQNLLGLNLP
jgi:hypothetical protein